jgi:hypothetical protein
MKHNIIHLPLQNMISSNIVSLQNTEVTTNIPPPRKAALLNLVIIFPSFNTSRTIHVFYPTKNNSNIISQREMVASFSLKVITFTVEAPMQPVCYHNVLKKLYMVSCSHIFTSGIFMITLCLLLSPTANNQCTL